jgi:hypothetical protein
MQCRQLLWGWELEIYRIVAEGPNFSTVQREILHVSQARCEEYAMDTERRQKTEITCDQVWLAMGENFHGVQWAIRKQY